VAWGSPLSWDSEFQSAQELNDLQDGCAHSLSSVVLPQRCKRAFADFPKEWTDLLDATQPDAVVEQAVYARMPNTLPTDCWGRGRVTLAGDAAHPIRPATGLWSIQWNVSSVTMCAASRVEKRRDLLLQGSGMSSRCASARSRLFPGSRRRARSCVALAAERLNAGSAWQVRGRTDTAS
jgi:hypothetical protein